MTGPVSIKTFNIANAVADEMTEEWCFGKRLQYVIGEINKTPSDVVFHKQGFKGEACVPLFKKFESVGMLTNQRF